MAVDLLDESQGLSRSVCCIPEETPYKLNRDQACTDAGRDETKVFGACTP
jgi:hypothetical protein